MGKGDRKSKKGKIHLGTFGKRRPRKIKQVQEKKEVSPPQKK